MAGQNGTSDIDVVLFDFGGVLADKGFEEGLRAIADRHGLDGTWVYNLAGNLIHTTGYLTGHAGEDVYWQAIRENTGITDADDILRKEILSRFIVRPWMLDVVIGFKAAGIGVAILSDQTNWLDELNERYDFFKRFDAVFNSYHLGKSKVDPSHFFDTAARLNRPPHRLLFVDDSEANCRTARGAGLYAIRFVDRDSFLKDLEPFYPGESRPAGVLQ